MKEIEGEYRESFYNIVSTLLAEPFIRKMLKVYNHSLSDLKIKALRKNGKQKKMRKDKY